MADQVTPSSRIYVRNLPSSLSLKEFRQHFAKQAIVTDAKYVPHRRFGYVGYKTNRDAEQAVAYFDKSFLGMARMRVEIAKPYPVHDARPSKRLKGTHEAGLSHHIGHKRLFDAQSTYASLDSTTRATAEPDAAMLEYVQAMRQPDKRKTWLNEGNELETFSAQPGLGDERSALNTVTTSSNTHRGDSKERSDTSHVDLPYESSTISFEQDLLNAQPSIETVIPPTQVESQSHVGSDADWLRSRTSRLLDLVDEEEGDEDDRSAPVKMSSLSSRRSSTSVETQDEKAQRHIADESNVATLIGEQSKDDMIANSPNSISDRLFIRNLTYTVTLSELREFLTGLGHGEPIEINLPIDSRSGQNKGFAHVAFKDATTAENVLRDSDQVPLQGRILHVLPGAKRRETGLDDFELTKLPLKMQQLVRQRRSAASVTFNWNSLFMNSDAVVSSVADRMGVSKSDILDPSSSEAAVKQAIAETHTIEETKRYFASQGVCLSALKSQERGSTSILFKNFPYGTKVEELRALIEQYAPVAKLLMPPAGTIAIAKFDREDHTKIVFGKLAYRRFKDTLLFLEKGPEGLFPKEQEPPVNLEVDEPSIWQDEIVSHETGAPSSQSFGTSTLFVRNLNFSTTSQVLWEAFATLSGFRSARVKTKSDAKRPGHVLSMGFGFLEFESSEKAEAALNAVDGFNLDGHKLLARASHGENLHDRASTMKSKNASTKIIIKNLPFEVSKKDVRALFGTYGKLQSIRLPRKFDNSTRGFAFATFTSAREAENAVKALGNTHLLGRRLVLEMAAADENDAEAEIDKMQMKAGRQSDRVALQKLTGTGRHKFVMEGAADHADP